VPNVSAVLISLAIQKIKKVTDALEYSINITRPYHSLTQEDLKNYLRETYLNKHPHNSQRDLIYGKLPTREQEEFYLRWLKNMSRELGLSQKYDAFIIHYDLEGLAPEKDDYRD